MEKNAGRFPDSRGYTQSVDMWSLGCLTGVLLTGFSPFFDPHTNQFSQTLARKSCIYQSETEPEWLRLGDRPKDFVRRLLVARAETRMTAKKALTHEWFNNKAHKREFEAVYGRALKSWRPRRAVGSIVCDYSTDFRTLTLPDSQWPSVRKGTSTECKTTGSEDGKEDAGLLMPSPPIAEKQEQSTCDVDAARTNRQTRDASKFRSTENPIAVASGAMSSTRQPQTEIATKALPLAPIVSGNESRTGIGHHAEENVRVQFVQKGHGTENHKNTDFDSPLYSENEQHSSKINNPHTRLPFSRDAWNSGAEPRLVGVGEASIFSTEASRTHAEWRSINGNPAVADGGNWHTKKCAPYPNPASQDFGRRAFGGAGGDGGGGGIADGSLSFDSLEISQKSSGRLSRGTVAGKRKMVEESEDEDVVFEETEDLATGSKVRVAYASRF